MCGRYSLTTPVEALRRLFRFEQLPNLAPRYNIAPTQLAPVVRASATGREIVNLRWGLVPAWAKEIAGPPLINARAESVAEKPSFRNAFAKRRCLVPTDGFYEWEEVRKGVKQPWRIVRRDGEPYAFAGLWESWRAPDGTNLESFTILTTAASSELAPLHDRMPVILATNDHGRWLDEAAPRDELQALLKPFPSNQLRAYPVSTRVNKVANDDPGCIAPLAATAT
jgi:putative SOS response-associated peptidase YedK